MAPTGRTLDASTPPNTLLGIYSDACATSPEAFNKNVYQLEQWWATICGHITKGGNNNY